MDSQRKKRAEKLEDLTDEVDRIKEAIHSLKGEVDKRRAQIESRQSTIEGLETQLNECIPEAELRDKIKFVDEKLG